MLTVLTESRRLSAVVVSGDRFRCRAGEPDVPVYEFRDPPIPNPRELFRRDVDDGGGTLAMDDLVLANVAGG